MVISQKVKPIDFYSRKITGAQIRYTVTEMYILNIVSALKSFITILLGQILRIYTGHKKLTCNNFKNDILLRWIIILDECGLDIEYIKG